MDCLRVAQEGPSVRLSCWGRSHYPEDKQRWYSHSRAIYRAGDLQMAASYTFVPTS